VEHIEGTFIGAEDHIVYYQGWQPSDETRAVLLMNHGIEEHSGRYINLVKHLVPLGYAMYGHDCIGHGKTEGVRVFVEDYQNLKSTLDIFKAMVRAWHPQMPFFMFGYSMGCLISLDYLLDTSEDFSGAIFASPTFTVPPGITKLEVGVTKLLSKLAPKIRVTEFDINDITQDPKAAQAYLSDPLIYEGNPTARFMAELLKGINRVQKDMEKFSLPFLVLQGGADNIADPAGSRMLYERADAKQKTLKVYDGFNHGLFIEPGHDQVLDDVEVWLDQQL